MRVMARLEFRQPVEVIQGPNVLPPPRADRGPSVRNDVFYIDGVRVGTVMALTYDSGREALYTDSQVEPTDFVQGAIVNTVDAWLDLPTPAVEQR